MKKEITIVLVFCMLVMSSACANSTDKVEMAVKEFEYACNNLDVEALLGCIDPDVAQPIEIALIALEKLIHMDKEDMVEYVLEGIIGVETSLFMNTISIEVKDTAIEKTAGSVKCVLMFEKAGVSFDKNITVDVIKKDEKWYISGISLKE